MVFSSPTFIFVFLPIVLGLYYLARGSARNYVLLAASLFFYFSGEGIYTVVLLASIGFNYVFGLLLDRSPSRQWQKVVLIAAISINVGMLVVFKYSNFVVDNMNYFLMRAGLSTVSIPLVHLPIGISFFTFQALSYVIDVYRGEIKAEPSLLNLAVYKSLFPQLIAGPIVRYTTIATELSKRLLNLDMFAEGVRRFIIGLSKKMLIANTVALTADQIFALPSDQLTFAISWLGIICYSLQIYFDFSGYSDMAIGLGLMLGFHFLENFNYPYISQSVREFWRRWHISLSTWFRDYLYIPLGGSRGSTFRTYSNLLIVYFLTGLWHGASWTFVAWGMFHGFFMVIERIGLDIWLARQWRWIRHAYLLLVVMIGWVFFRVESISSAWNFLGAMFGLYNRDKLIDGLDVYLNSGLVVIILVGILASGPIQNLWTLWKHKADTPTNKDAMTFVDLVRSLGYVCVLSILFLLSIVKLAADTYNPFIYFRF